MSKKTDNLRHPLHIEEKLKKTGYFDLTIEQSVREEEKFLKTLANLKNLNYHAGKKFLNDMRGGNW
jgi:hypothetical protein